ncbi:MAG: hypothetical protein ACKV0T_15815 [Planctomycetales bacterium]
MAEEFDVYQNCPCGSGKKLKFCCHAIIGEMQRISDLQKHQQFSLAQNALEALDKKPHKEAWSRAWIKSNLSVVHMQQGQAADALRLAREVLDELPTHPLASSLNALLTLQSEGYPAAKRAIYEALQVQAGRVTSITVHLLRALSMVLIAQRHFLAAREYLAQAVMFDPKQQEIIQSLAALIHAPTIPYPLRSPYRLEPFLGDDSLRSDYLEALQQCATGCFGDAAKSLGKIARQMPTAPWVWWNIALCHAWAGEEPLAVRAFKAAADNQPDLDSAAECLLMARLLSPIDDQWKSEQLAQQLRVKSVSRLLSLLDSQPRIVRVPVDPEDAQGQGPVPVGAFHILDREPSTLPYAEWTFDTVPRLLATLEVYDAPPDRSGSAVAFLSSLESERLPELTRQILDLAGPEAEVGDQPPVVTGVTSRDQHALTIPWALPDDVPFPHQSRLEGARWRHIQFDVWPHTPQFHLDGKSPVEAAQDPALKAPLMASILALEVLAEQAGCVCDSAALREKLSLSPQARLDPTLLDETRFVPPLRARRLPLSLLPDKLLISTAQVAQQLGMVQLTYSALRTLTERLPLIPAQELPTLYQKLAELSQQRFELKESLDWAIKAKQAARDAKIPLLELLDFEFREVALRIAVDESDPQIATLAETIWTYYRPKLPEAAALISAVLLNLELPGPWNQQGLVSGSAEPLAVGAVSEPTGLWTPGSQTPGEPSKIWVPGQ